MLNFTYKNQWFWPTCAFAEPCLTVYRAHPFHISASRAKVSQQTQLSLPRESQVHISMSMVYRTHVHAIFCMQSQWFWPNSVFAEAMVDGLSRAFVCIEIQAGAGFLSLWHPFCDANLHGICPCQRFPARICMLHFSHKFKGSD